MTQPYDYIYLSPHYDDAALSCGGAIHQQVAAGQAVLVITIFAAPPETQKPLSPFAEKLHQAWGSPDDVVAARRAEDQTAMEILQVDFRRLSFMDCIYRGNRQSGTWYYTSEVALFGQIQPVEVSLIQQLLAELSKQVTHSPKAVVCAPLAVGHHVDHQLTYAAAAQLQQQGRSVVFYEDYPYSDPHYPFARATIDVERSRALEATLIAKQTANLQPHLRHLSETDLQAKLDSIRAYTSQLSILFGGETAMEKYVRAYAFHIGQDRPAERIWIPV